MEDPHSTDGLTRLDDRQSIREYVGEAWARRQFAIVVPASDIRAQNMDTGLGQLWHIINPAMLIGVYFAIFGVVLDVRRGVDNFLGFLVVGVILFQLTQRVALDAAVVIRRNEGLIRSIQFPRVLLPVSSLNAQTFAFLPSLLVVAVAMVLTGEIPTLAWLALVPILLAQYLINLGIVLIAARVGAFVPDLGQILPHLFRLLFYVSGVIFSVEAFVEDESVRRLFVLNPVYGVLSLARWSMMGLDVDGLVVVATAVWAVVLPLVGIVYFRNAEARYGG